MNQLTEAGGTFVQALENYPVPNGTIATFTDADRFRYTYVRFDGIEAASGRRTSIIDLINLVRIRTGYSIVMLLRMPKLMKQRFV